MVAWLVLIGALLVPTAAFLLWSWRGSRNDMALMRATETTRAADIAKLPVGSVVEVKGRLRCTTPLTAELSKSPCAHFVATVERDYEIWEYDVHRKTSCRVRKREIVQSNTVFAPFEIEDESGRAIVSPDDAIIEGIAAVDRYDAHHQGADDEGVTQAIVGAVTTTIGRSAFATRRCTCRSTSRSMCSVSPARTVASKPLQLEPRGSASSSASNPRRRVRRNSAPRANGCWGLVSSA